MRKNQKHPGGRGRKNPNRAVQVGLYLPRDGHERLKALAEAQEVSMGDVVVSLLEHSRPGVEGVVGNIRQAVDNIRNLYDVPDDLDLQLSDILHAAESLLDSHAKDESPLPDFLTQYQI